MTLSQAQYFIALCNLLNFSRAAEICNVSQPAFSRSISRLEDELGGSLVFRERNHTQLTELGKAIRPHLEAMLGAAKAASGVAAARDTHRYVSLKIGLGPGVGSTMVAPAIGKVVADYPNIAIQIDEMTSSMSLEAMLNHTLDCALLPDDYEIPNRFNHWPLYSDKAMVVLPPGHRLLSKNKVTAYDLQNEVLLFSDKCGSFIELLRKTTKYPYKLQRCASATSQTFELINAGLGLTLLSNYLGVPAPLTTRPLQEPYITRRVMLVALAGRQRSSAAAAFLSNCRKQKYDTLNQYNMETVALG